MLKLSKIESKEASRVYGDLAEKVAFTVDLNPVNILASALGGYAATRTYDSIQDNRLQEELGKKTLENDHYANIQHILKDLRIIFTPINVVYSVNGQVFEIIKTSEMSSDMRKRFIAKDGEYFKNLLLNKMNMELQLAEQVFTKKLIQNNLPDQYKLASHYSMRWLEKLSFAQLLHDFEGLEKVASQPFKLDFSLDAFRPFDSMEAIKHIDKVANYFSADISESLSHKDLENSVKIGFLPDRVLFIYNGQLLEQLPALHMNNLGYNAFQKRDKQFFMNFFLEESKRIEAAVVSQAAKEVVESFENNEPSLPSLLKNAAAIVTEDEEDSWVDDFASILQNAPTDPDADEDELPEEEDESEDDVEKSAASLEEVRSSWDEHLVIEKEQIDLWLDTDIHPLAYDSFLDHNYGTDWHEKDLTALLTQLIQDFNLEGINGIVSDKLAFLQMVQTPKHSVYLSAFTFEKFMRAMNSKTTDFTDFEGNLEFEEILFALDLVKSFDDTNLVFYEFGEDVSNHLAKLLKADGIRYISDQLYDEQHEAEKEFFEEVNGFLLRMWKEEDSRSLTDDEATAARDKTVRINDVVETIVRDYAEDLKPKNPYTSAEEVLRAKNHLFHLSVEEQVAVIDLVGRHVIATTFLELKRHELVVTLDLLKEAGGQDE